MRVLIFLLIGFNLNAQLSNNKIKKWISSQDNLKSAYVSIAIKPLQKDRKIKGVNINKYMTPASNLKLLTVLASIKSGDSINSLKYKFVSDTLHISPTGYPLLEHPLYADQELTNLLSSANVIVYHNSPNQIEKYGPAWAWDDIIEDFSPERNSFPVYGNVIMVTKSENGKLKVKPDIFDVNLDSTLNVSHIRKEHKNQFTINPLKINLKDTLLIPYIVSDETIQSLIKHITEKEVIAESSEIINPKKLYSKIPDKIYQAILKDSDNLISESLLANVGYIFTDTISVNNGIDKTLEKLSPEIQNNVEWFDGSGLSRYNMIKPKALISILKEIYNSWGLKKIKEIFPNNYIIQDKEDFVWGKTGTLKNNHNYSGFIKTKKGRYYIFSIMINHFTSELADVEKSIADFLVYLNQNGRIK